jgi:hypothetical protein
MKITEIIIIKGTMKFYLIWGAVYVAYVLGTIGALLALMDWLGV